MQPDALEGRAGCLVLYPNLFLPLNSVLFFSYYRLCFFGALFVFPALYYKLPVALESKVVILLILLRASHCEEIARRH